MTKSPIEIAAQNRGDNESENYPYDRLHIIDAFESGADRVMLEAERKKITIKDMGEVVPLVDLRKLFEETK